MLEHHHQSQASYHQLQPLEQFLQVVDTPNCSEINLKIEDYLDHAYAPLVGTMPYEKRQEIRSEMKAHLLQMIAAHMELGDSQDEAVEASLKQFGQPKKIAINWLQSLHDIYPAKWYENRSVKQSFLYSSAILSGTVSLYVMILSALDHSKATDEWLIAATVSAGLVIPFFSGLRVGKKSHPRPVLGMLLAQSIILPLWPLLMVTLHNLFSTSTAHYDEEMWRVGLFSYILLAPTGCLGARLGRFLKTRRKRLFSFQR